MKRVLSETVWTAFALISTALLLPALAHAEAAAAPGATALAGRVCCVKGTWAGTITQSLSRTCPEPTINEKFTFVLTQGAACTRDVTGQVTTAKGQLMNFVGAASKPAQKNCCHLEGTLTKPADLTEHVSIAADFCTTGETTVATGTAHSVSGEPGRQKRYGKKGLA